MRTFIAIPIPALEREHLHHALSPLRAADLPVRWTPADNLHVTLHFLGDIEDDRVESLEAVLHEAARESPPFALQLGGLGAFPSARRASVWWLGVSREPELLTLRNNLGAGLRRIDHVPEERPFHPHVTIGRARARRPPALSDDWEERIGYRSTMAVEEVTLMHSRPQRGGARYDVLIRTPLRGAAAR